MFRLMMFMLLLVAPMVMGVFVIAAILLPDLGLANMNALPWVAVAGFLVGIPVALKVAVCCPLGLTKGYKHDEKESFSGQ